MDEQSSVTDGQALARGRDAAGHSEWTEAYGALSEADASSTMGPADLELLATAAYLMGHVHDSVGALQRAYQRHVEGGDLTTRCAVSSGCAST